MRPAVLRRSVVLVLAVVQILAPAFIFPDGFGGFPAATREPAEPAGYAFSIWGVIYAGCLAYGIYQALPGQARDPLPARIAAPAATLFLGSTLWLLAARHAPALTIPIIWAMLASAAVALFWITRPELEPRGARRWLTLWPFGLYAGWLSAAAFVNVSTVLPRLGWDRFGLTPEGLALVVIPAAAALALLLLGLFRGALPYALAVVWALVAIALANAQGPAPVAWAASLAAVALLVALLALRARQRARRRHAPALHAPG